MKFRRVSNLAIAALLVFCATHAPAGINTWHETGPNAANVRVEFARNPSSAVAYARGGDKFWRSSDGGVTWVQKLSANTDEYAFTVDPNDGNLVVLQGPGFQNLMRSTNGGDTFTSLGATFDARVLKFGGLSYNTLFAISDYPPYLRKSINKGTNWTSGADTGLPPPPMGGLIPQPVEIAIGGMNADVIYFGFRHPDYPGIYKSTDGGMTWTPGMGLQGVFVNAIAVAPAAPGAAFVATDNGLYFSGDNGDSWTKVADPTGTGVATAPLSAVAFDKLDPLLLYAGGRDRGEIFRSADYGLTWQRRDQGIVATRINSISPRENTSGEILAGTSHTLYRTTNSGQGWSVSATGIRSASVSVLQNGSKLRAGLFDGGIYESEDATTWTPINNLALRSSLREQKFTPIISLTEPGKLFAIFEASGDLTASVDGGNTWQRAATFNYLHNGSNGGFVTEAGSGPVHYATSYSGVDKSFDDGLTWSTYNNGLPSPPLVTKLAKNADGTKLFAGMFNQGLYRSIDGGANWTAINNGLVSPNSLVIRRLVYDEANNVLVVGTNDGLLISRNDGDSYTPLASPIPGNQVSTDSLLVEDFDHGSIYCGTNGRVFRSVDQGASWTELSAGAVTPTSFTSVRDLVGDGPGVIFAGYVYSGIHVFTVAPDMQLTTSAPTPGVYAVGATLPWSVTVRNDGPLASTFAHFTWALPPNIAASNITTSRGTCAVSTSRVLNCDLGVMQPAQTAAISMTLTGIAGGTVYIDAAAGAAEVDSQPNNNRFMNSGVRFLEQVDLAATLVASAATVDSGATVDYTLTVHNNGPDAATGGSIHMGFDTRDQYVLTQGPNDCVALRAPVCLLPTIGSGDTVTWKWRVTVVPGGARNPGVTLVSIPDSTNDTNPANNGAAAALTVVAVNDLQLALVGAGPTVERGATVQYTLQVSQTAVIPAPGVVVHLNLSAGLQFASSTGVCSSNGLVVTCNLGTLGVGGMNVVNVTLNATAAADVNITADVSGTNPDRNLANNSAATALTILPVGDLAATLTGSVATVQTSTAFSYSLTVSNSAGSDTANATARVTLSNLLTYTSAAGATCTANASVVSCDVGSVAPGASTVVTINVSAITAGNATSSAEVMSSIRDTNAANNTVNAALVSVTNPPPPPAPAPPPSRGGGGAFDYLTALLLAGLLVMALRARRRSNGYSKARA